MRIAFFDCFAGVSGDMTVAALISAGMPIEHLRSQLQKLPLSGYELSTHLIERSMISAVKFDVKIGHDHDHDHDHHGDHHHEHDQNHHDHDHHHETHLHSHGMSYASIRDQIVGSGLSERVKTRSLAIFRAIGEAEARIHNKPLEEIHFHEVGAVDSIVDIVSTAIGLEYFDVESCRSRAVPLGSGGMIDTAHGRMPIPTPATLEILKGYPTELGPVAREMTTPTGAGIIRALSNGLLAQTDHLEPTAIGYGAGTMEFAEVPNLLRLVIGDLKSATRTGSAFPEHDTVVQITTVIDDMTPVHLAAVHEQLFEAGALEAYLRPVLMKKGRAGHELVILTEDGAEESILALLARETTTLGVRIERVTRRIAHRELSEVEHPDFGLVHTKRIQADGFPRTEPEFEDVKRIAREHRLPMSEVLERLRRDLA